MGEKGVDREVVEKALGLRLQNARKSAGLTQQELCQKSDLSYSTLAKIERGAIKSPSIFTIQQIAGALGVSLDELIGVESAKQAVAKRRSKTGISFVYFDINGCLVRFFHRAFTDAAKDFGLPSDIVESTYWHYTDAVCRGDMSLEEFNIASAEKFSIESLDWAKYYLGAVEPVAEAKELIEWVRNNYKIGLLSNIMPGMIEIMRLSNLIPDVAYDSIIDSSVVHAIKPEPKIFEIATEKAGCEPSDTLLIDDSRANLLAAERLGWHVLWFDDYRPAESIARIKQALVF
jgi:FMN phosphatase YigB (HAD superfamily)/DNA-binding XRE family transcriptional regulator